MVWKTHPGTEWSTYGVEIVWSTHGVEDTRCGIQCRIGDGTRVRTRVRVRVRK